MSVLLLITISSLYYLCKYLYLVDIMMGKVTKVNPFMCYFEVENTFRIYIDLALDPPMLPALNNEIVVHNPQRFCMSTLTAVVGFKTICSFGEECNAVNGDVINLLVGKSIYKDPDEIIAIDCIERKLEPFIAMDDVMLCIECLHRNVMDNNMETFTKIRVVSAKDLNFVHSNSEKYHQFFNFNGETCNFTVYHNKRLDNVINAHCEYLVGILSVSRDHGSFILKDQSTEILVKFAHPQSDLYKLNNSLVVITKYSVFSEIYKDTKRPTLKYILTTVQDVIKIKDDYYKCQETLFYGKDKPYQGSYTNTFYLQIKKVSEIIYGYRNGPECWLEAAVIYNLENGSSESLYVILPTELIVIAPFLNETKIYKIHSEQKFLHGNIFNFRELYGMKELQKVLLIDAKSVFEETDITFNCRPEIVMDTFEAVKTHIDNTTNYKTCSLSLKIFKKVWKPWTYPSWYPKRFSNVELFGDLDNCQQNVTFYDEVTKTYIDVFLSNRDNHITPLGLLPGMKVKINHLQVLKRRYLKSTVFTSFEVIEYCPKFPFSSPSLLFEDITTWQWRGKTHPTLMGHYMDIPVNSLICGTFLMLAIVDLGIRTVCKKCVRLMREANCSRCDGNQKDVEVFLIIQVSDSINPAFYVEVENKYFLMDILGLKDEHHAFDNLFAKHVRPIQVDFLKISQKYKIHDADAYPILQRMIELISNDINYKSFPVIEALCIKQMADELHKPLRLLDYYVTD